MECLVGNNSNELHKPATTRHSASCHLHSKSTSFQVQLLTFRNARCLILFENLEHAYGMHMPPFPVLNPLATVYFYVYFTCPDNPFPLLMFTVRSHLL